MKESKNKKFKEKLKQEILDMVSVDQKMRKTFKIDASVDKRNTERVKEIIKEYGWPGRSLVGEEAAHGVWLLVQHADYDIEFQKQALKLLEQAVKEGEAEKRNLAYLTDRVKVNSGELQLFGTQFYKDKNGKFNPRPIKDLKHLDERRKEFGLESFVNYKKEMQKISLGLK